MTGTEAETQEISVPLEVGSRVTLMEDVDIEENDEGHTASVFFEGYVEQYVPETGLLKFDSKELGRAEFKELLEQAEGIEILKER